MHILDNLIIEKGQNTIPQELELLMEGHLGRVLLKGDTQGRVET